MAGNAGDKGHDRKEQQDKGRARLGIRQRVERGDHLLFYAEGLGHLYADRRERDVHDPYQVLGEDIYAGADIHRVHDEGVAHREHHNDEGEACHDIDTGHLAADIELVHKGDAEGQTQKRKGVGLEGVFGQRRCHGVELGKRPIGEIGSERRVRRGGHQRNTPFGEAGRILGKSAAEGPCQILPRNT